MNVIKLTVLCTICAIAVHVGAAEVPTLINYQGRLVDAEGIPLETANRDLVVNIYDAAVGGDVIWGPQIMAQTPVVNGYYNILLGPVDESDQQRPIEEAFMGEHRYLEVTVNDEPMSPRQRILSAPYALQSQNAVQAENADTLDGFDWRAILLNGGTNPSTTKIDGSNVTRVPEASIAHDLTGTPREELTGTVADLNARGLFFYARPGTGAGTKTDGVPLQFKNEILDTVGYNAPHGLFTAPYKGLYEINLSMFMQNNTVDEGGYIGVEVLKAFPQGGGQSLGRFVTHREQIEKGAAEAVSGTLLMSLEQGEAIHLKAIGTFRLDDNDYSHYTGKLVHLLE